MLHVWGRVAGRSGGHFCSRPVLAPFEISGDSLVGRVTEMQKYEKLEKIGEGEGLNMYLPCKVLFCAQTGKFWWS